MRPRRRWWRRAPRSTAAALACAAGRTSRPGARATWAGGIGSRPLKKTPRSCASDHKVRPRRARELTGPGANRLRAGRSGDLGEVRLEAIEAAVEAGLRLCGRVFRGHVGLMD